MYTVLYQTRKRLEMRSKFIRALAVAGALTALSIPVVNAGQASACSTGATCSTSNNGGGTLDSYVSPLSVSSPTSNIERATTAQVPGTITLNGTVGFTVEDPRGNDQGFAVALSSTDYNSSLFNFKPAVAASAVNVTGPAAVVMTCFTNPLEGLACAAAHGYYDPAAQAETMDANPIVAVQCPTQSIGFGAYAVNVPISAKVTGTAAELFGSLPVSLDATYMATVYEGGLANPGRPFSFVNLGCPTETANG